MSGNCNSVMISCQICEEVRSDMGCCGKPRTRARTDDVGYNFFSNIAFMSSYFISSGSMSNPGEMCCKTDSGSTSIV